MFGVDLAPFPAPIFYTCDIPSDLFQPMAEFEEPGEELDFGPGQEAHYKEHKKELLAKLRLEAESLKNNRDHIVGELAKLDALFDSLDADGSGDLHIGDIGRGPRPSLDSPRAQEMADLHLQHSEDSESGDGAALLQKGRKAVRSRPALG